MAITAIAVTTGITCRKFMGFFCYLGILLCVVFSGLVLMRRFCMLAMRGKRLLALAGILVARCALAGMGITGKIRAQQSRQ